MIDADIRTIRGLGYGSCGFQQLRGHSLKLQKAYCRTSVRQHFFAERVVNEWNALPEAVVSAPSLNCFKERLKRSLPHGQEG